MRQSLPRWFTQTARRALFSPATSCEAKGATASDSLPPVRYHIFNTPLPYPVGLKLQSDVIERRLKAREAGRSSAQDVLFLLEHTPTYTTGRRDNTPNPDQLHPEEKKVQNVGAGFYITKRGGQVTYHGPGQIVGYPLLDLNAMGTPTRCYVEYLQALLADYCRDLGLEVLAPHPEGHVGVFANPNEKVASIGIHLRHRITSHGFAMNITPEPKAWFDLVTACGLDDVRAVSIHDMLSRLSSPKPSPSVVDVAQALVPRFEAAFGRSFVPLSDPVDGELAEEVAGIREIVEQAERESDKAKQEAGGWPTKPSISAAHI